MKVQIQDAMGGRCSRLRLYFFAFCFKLLALQTLLNVSKLLKHNPNRVLMVEKIVYSQLIKSMSGLPQVCSKVNRSMPLEDLQKSQYNEWVAQFTLTILCQILRQSNKDKTKVVKIRILRRIVNWVESSDPTNMY